MIKVTSIVQNYEEPHLEKNELLTKIQSKIPNFRDLAIFNQSYIRPNVIYRSASPIEHQTPELLQDFKDLGIKSIIDLRSAVEIGYASYNDDFVNSFNYYWVHIDISMPPEVLLREGKTDLSFYKQFCWYTLYYNKAQIRRIFNILSQEENYSTIIHCFAGRDRTGITSCLILLLLNAPEPNIIQDYLETDEYTLSEDMEYIFDKVEEEGGIKKYLVSCGLQEDTLERMITQLRP